MIDVCGFPLKCTIIILLDTKVTFTRELNESHKKDILFVQSDFNAKIESDANEHTKLLKVSKKCQQEALR